MIRQASARDASAVVTMFDAAIDWFVEIGNTAQWGTTPFSRDPRRVDQVRSWCRAPGAWLEVDEEGTALAALVLGDAHDYVPAPELPEIYVKVLISSRASRARGAGRRLMAFADEQARAAGVAQLRVDCYAGGSGKLVAFYESCGYRRDGTFRVRDWPGQILVKPVARS